VALRFMGFTPNWLLAFTRKEVVTKHGTSISLLRGYLKTNLRGLSPRGNYADRATAACRRR
jgi:hypothetical protein